MKRAGEILEEMRGPGRGARDKIPDVYAGFAAIDHAVMNDGALTKKTKQLIALAISVSRECDGCIASHARAAWRAGATEDEVAEALGVVIQMDGGPATTWGPRAFAVFREFAGVTQ